MEKVKIVIIHQISKIREWVKENRLEAGILLLILLVGAFFRLYKIDQYMTFLGDEGRDVIIVRRLLTDFDPILVGPGTSIGNMYLGPIYYYLMAPALLLANFSPAGPAVMVALLGVGTIFFVWYIAREWFGKIAAVIASVLYAISPTVIIYSRSSWNPNIMPFFALLTIYSIWQFWQKNKFGWVIVTGLSFAFALQSHYLGLLLAPVIGIFWLLILLKVRRTNLFRSFIRMTLISAILFIILMSPLVIFDARHGWRNFSAINKFFTQRQTTVSARPWTAIPKLGAIAEEISVRLIAGTNKEAGKWTLSVIVAGLFLTVILVSKKISSKEEYSPYLLLLVWIGFALIGLGVYKQEIYDHYYGFFFTAPFILIGGISERFIKTSKEVGIIVTSLVVLGLVLVNLQNNPLKYPPNRQLQRTSDIVKKIIEVAEGNTFNIAVIAERNYEGAYQYYLERWGAPFIIIDPQRFEETVTQQLFVVCELPKEKCDPLNHPKSEIANFGWKKIDETWEVAGVLLYKLGHTK